MSNHKKKTAQSEVNNLKSY